MIAIFGAIRDDIAVIAGAGDIHPVGVARFKAGIEQQVAGARKGGGSGSSGHRRRNGTLS